MKSSKLLFAIHMFIFSQDMTGAMRFSIRETNEDSVDTIDRLQSDLDEIGEHSSNGDRNFLHVQ